MTRAGNATRRPAITTAGTSAARRGRRMRRREQWINGHRFLVTEDGIGVVELQQVTSFIA